MLQLLELTVEQIEKRMQGQDELKEIVLKSFLETKGKALWKEVVL